MLNNIHQAFNTKRASDPLRRWVPYSAFITDQIFVTKTGAMGITLKMEGYDYETKTQEQLEQISKKLVIANKIFDTRFRVYHHMLKRENGTISRKSEYPSPLVAQLVNDRAEHLESLRLFEIHLYTTILIEPTTSGFGFIDRLIEEKLRKKMNIELSENVKALQDVAYAYASQLGDLMGITPLDREGCFQHLRSLLNPELDTDIRLKYLSDVDYYAADTDIRKGRTRIEWGEYGTRVFVVKEEPDSTFSHLLRDLLRIPGNLHLTFEWRPTDRAPMVEYLKRKRRRFYSQRQSSVEGALEAEGAELQKDAAMTENAEVLNQAIRELRNRGNYFCDYSMTVVVFDRDETNLRRSCQLTKQAFADKGATLMEETQNAVRAFFATLPGNSVLNLRYRSLQNLNIADLTPCCKPSEGSKRNDYLEDEYMTVMQTADNTVRYLNLHYGEVAATLITGTTGSGKSLLIDQFIDDAQKYDPYTFVLDVGGSHRLSTRRHNGVYSHVRLNEKSFGVNPFRQPYSPQSVNVILEFLRVLLLNEGHVMTSDEEQLILREIHIVFGLPENRRRIGKLSLPRELRKRLHFWIDGGPFSHFVDSDRDDLILSKFQTWDFTDLEEVPKLLGPLMWYLSRWISRVVTDPCLAHQAKVCFMDEAWRFGDLEDFIRSAAKTWRKHRAWIVLATQDEEDLRKNNILQLVNTQCHTKIFMSNPGADVRLYSDTFKFNEREAELLETMKIGEFFVKTPAGSYLCIYNPSTQRLAEYKTQFQSQTKEKDLVTL